jgi:hypothetical protein
LVPRHVADNRSNGRAHASADLPRLGSELRRSDNRQRVPCYVFSKNGKGGQFGSFALTRLMCRQCYGAQRSRSEAGRDLSIETSLSSRLLYLVVSRRMRLGVYSA